MRRIVMIAALVCGLSACAVPMVLTTNDKGELARCEPGTLATFREKALSANRQSIASAQPTAEEIAAQAEQLTLGKPAPKVNCSTYPDGCAVCCGNIICCASCPGSGSTTCCGPVNCTDYPKTIKQ